MLKCSWGNHAQEAKWQVEIIMWALPMPPLLRNLDNCVRMLSQVTVCDECKTKITPQHMLPNAARERISNAMQQIGRAQLDYANARLNFLEIVDEPIDPAKHIPPGAHVIEG